MVAVESVAPPSPPVTLVAGEEASGLANMVGQYLEQLLATSPEKCAEAALLRGRFGLRATEGSVAVTIVFDGDRVLVEEGLCEPDAVIGGPVETLMHMLAGRANPAVEVFRGAITVAPGAHPLFGLRVYQLMRLPGVHVWSALPRPPLAVVAGAAAVLGAVVIVRIARRRSARR